MQAQNIFFTTCRSLGPVASWFISEASLGPKVRGRGIEIVSGTLNHLQEASTVKVVSGSGGGIETG